MTFSLCVVGNSERLLTYTGCMCHHMGAINNICNYQSGKCKCKEGVGGDHCDQCVSGYWGFGKSSLGGCTKCNCCTEGSESCSQVSISVYLDLYIAVLP